MTIHVTFDPSDQEDVAYVLNLLGGEAEAPAPKKASKKAAAPEPEPEDDGEPTMEDAVARATELVGEGRTADVKGALANLGVKRVSELEESQIAEFLEAVSEDNLV